MITFEQTLLVNLEQKAPFLLETLERSYHHHEPVDFATLTIEHVMSQTLTPEWQTYLGEDWKTTYDLYLHTLGNLTLTGCNSPLSNNLICRQTPAVRQQPSGTEPLFHDRRAVAQGQYLNRGRPR
ncbi:MAG: HNH endonuclease family protein [Candidatus Competibacteraceae bacterium]